MPCGKTASDLSHCNWNPEGRVRKNGTEKILKKTMVKMSLNSMNITFVFRSKKHSVNVKRDKYNKSELGTSSL